MRSILEHINGVTGVSGSFVCGEQGELLAAEVAGGIDDATLSMVARTAALTISGIRSVRRRRVQNLELHYAGGRLVIRNLRGGCLCILCARRISVPLLNLTVDVAAGKLSDILRSREKPAARPAAQDSVLPAEPGESAREEPSAGRRSGLRGFLRSFSE